jgi:hypothetical protein
MTFSPRLRLTNRQIIAQRCSTCTQPIGEQANADSNTHVNLCGAEKYVVCPMCDKFVPEELRTASYRRGWGRKSARAATNGLAVQTNNDDVDSQVTQQNSERQVLTPEEWKRERAAFESRMRDSSGD